nr:heparinase II/III family protein [uncultured Undibacterium sp.]
MTNHKLQNIEKWFGSSCFSIEGVVDIPSITELWEAGQEYLKTGQAAKAKQCELLIRILHNSSISINLQLGANVDFAYGGIGTVVHKDAEIGNNVMIGQNVTIGGAPGTSRLDARVGKKVSYPKIGDFVYIAAGARIIGGVEVGSFSIIGANAVLKKSVPPFSVCVGVPVKEVKKISSSAFLKYKGYWPATKRMTELDYLAFISREYDRLQGQVAISHDNASHVAAKLSDVDIANAAIENNEVLSALLNNTLASISQNFSPKDNFENCEGGLLVRLPFTKATFFLPHDKEMNWEPEFQSHAATNNVFFYSLQWVGEWLAAYELKQEMVYLSRAVDAVTSYLRYVESGSVADKTANIRSSDHSSSIRIRVLIKLLHLSRGQQIASLDFQRATLRHLLCLAEWVFNPENYKANNHGLMSSIALLHVAVQFRYFTGLSAKYESCAFERILSLANSAFDKDGYCNENTIGYHRFNTSLYESVQVFGDAHQISDSALVVLTDKIEKAKNALSYAIWQDGTVPPIGDSPVYEKVSRSINSSKLFSESGFLIIKNDDLYLSLICGSRSWIHKQCDDSSITLRYKNKNILIDAGHYTHDEKDPYRLALAGQRGHSGIFLEKHDAVLREEFMKNASPYEARITEFVEDAKGARAVCHYTLQGGAYRVERRVNVFLPDEILICDRVTSQGGDIVAARQRFIFDPAVTYNEGGKLKDVQDGGVIAVLMHFSSSNSDMYHADVPPNARGWCSVKFGELQPTSGLDFVQDGNAMEFVTVIKLADIDSVTDLSPQLRAELSLHGHE